jgi:2-polyprenyl-6-methoxyphenol hydroxylase-like FAD-dependent oxidoreductase
MSKLLTDEQVLIAGAGPAGLLLAILLAQHGIPSTVLELWDRLDERLRATQYGVPATRVFRRAGILDDIRTSSITRFPSICWRNVGTGERLTGIDLSVVGSEPDRMTVLPLNQLLQIMLRHCQEKYAEYVTVLFNHKVVDIGQDEDKAWAIVEAGADGEEKKTLNFQADYLIGCDGGQSTVRKCLFQRSWPGETFEHQLLVQNVSPASTNTETSILISQLQVFYDGFEEYGWDGGNYMIDPEFWGLIAKRGKPKGNQGTLWRVTYGDSVSNLSRDEYLKRREIAFKKMLPGHPDPSQYKVTDTDQFRIHNRCVEKMREGRIFLAADAAHVCNPFGGYGCMAGVLDVSGLADCLIGYYYGKADEDILDLYAKIRREKFIDLIDKRSRKNMDRLCKTDPNSVLKTDPFLVLLQSMEGDKEKTRDFLLVSLISAFLFKIGLADDFYRSRAVLSTTSPSIIRCDKSHSMLVLHQPLLLPPPPLQRTDYHDGQPI